MAVYTDVSRPELADWLSGHTVGELLEHTGVASGIENTNFFVTTTDGRYVLTLFERLSGEQLPFYLGLMHHLADHGIPCPDPVADRNGALWSELAGKPAALVTRLPGRDVATPDEHHCQLVGRLLASMHLSATGYPVGQPNLRGLDWWRKVAPLVRPTLDAEAATMLDDVLAEQDAFAGSALAAALPASAVHADLFRDNVLFDGAALGGVIDFYFAGWDFWLFDLAVACNDWCIDDATGEFDAARLAALLDAYATVRPFDDAEHRAWPTMLRAAALRFWLSRLDDLLRPRPAQLVSPKDPEPFRRILALRRRQVPPLPSAGGTGGPGVHGTRIH
jgi:homoserine kinase type II